MAYPTEWTRKCKLTIDHTKVSGDLSDFPVLLTVANLPSEMFDADGLYPALNGGGDIRFSSDALGATQLPCEVCQFVIDNTPANGLAEIYVKLSSISSSIDTIFYVWWGAVGQTQPGRSTTYGLENVWNSSFKGVWHLSEAWNGDVSNFKDSTVNVKHGTRYKAYGSTTVSTAGKWGGKCINFQGSTQFNATDGNAIEVDGSGALNFTATLTIEYWQQWDSYSGIDSDVWAVGKATGTGQDWKLRGLGMQETGSPPAAGYVWWNTTAGDDAHHSTNTYARNTWMHVAVSITNTSSMALAFYVNGAADGTSSPGSASTGGTRHWTMGEGYPNEYHRGHLDEVRISTTARSAQWIGATYNNSNAPNTFLAAGTPGKARESIQYFWSNN